MFAEQAVSQVVFCTSPAGWVRAGHEFHCGDAAAPHARGGGVLDAGSAAQRLLNAIATGRALHSWHATAAVQHAPMGGAAGFRAPKAVSSPAVRGRGAHHVRTELVQYAVLLLAALQPPCTHLGHLHAGGKRLCVTPWHCASLAVSLPNTAMSLVR